MTTPSETEQAFEEFIEGEYIALKTSPKYKIAKKAFAAGALHGAESVEKLEKRIKNEEICSHDNTEVWRDHLRCNDCGWFKTDSDDSDWGNNKNKWFYELPKQR